MTRQLRWRPTLSLVAAAVYCASTAAADGGISLATSLQHSDNMARQHSNTVSDTRYDTRLGLNHSVNRPQLSSSLVYQLRHQAYQQGTFDDKTRLQGQGEVAAELWPQRLKWLLSHHQQSLQRNEQQSETPDNEISRQRWRTGPVMDWQLTARDRLQVGISHSRTEFDEKALVDSRRDEALLQWRHGLTAKYNLVAEGRYGDVDLGTGSPGYRLRNISLGLEGQLRFGEYGLQLGQGEVAVDGRHYRGLEYDLYAAYRHAGIEWRLTGIRELTDSANGLRGQSLGGRDSNFDTLAILWRSRTELAVTAGEAGQRWSAGFRAHYDDNDPEVVLHARINNTRFQYGARADVGYRFSDRLSGRLQFSGRELRFEDDRSHRIGEVLAGLDFRLGKQLTLRGWSQYRRRSADDPLQAYLEWILAFGLRYQF